MKVSRLTPLNAIPPIHAPRWNGGKRVVGIADYRIKDANRIEIDYVRKSDGERVYPTPFFMRGNKIKTYPTQIVRGGVKLYQVPIDDLEPLEVI